MNKFPIINHLDDIVHEFKDTPGFVILEREWGTCIDYVFSSPETFTKPIHLEGRGLKFGLDGKILARPFHKFFNLNERPESSMEALDWCEPISVQTKLDGSMIHPVMLNGELHFMTRKGLSDVAVQALHEVDMLEWDRREMINYMETGYTPIYEFTSPTNRIVLPYEKSELRLLAVRNNVTGNYLSIVPRQIKLITECDFVLENFVQSVRELKGDEGVVLVWPDGHRVKIKADEYVALHRCIDLAGSERRIIEVILNNQLDDLIPMLDDDRKVWIGEYASKLRSSIQGRADKLTGFVEKANAFDMSPKDFAFAVQTMVDKPLWAAYFAYRQTGEDAYSLIAKQYLRQLKTAVMIESHRDGLLDGNKLTVGGI